MARAVSSLPVPLSPRMSTVDDVGATPTARRYTSCMLVVLPISSPKVSFCSSLRSSISVRLSKRRRSAALDTVSTTSSFERNGFSRKSYAPARTDLTATSTSPKAVIMITSTPG